MILEEIESIELEFYQSVAKRRAVVRELSDRTDAMLAHMRTNAGALGRFGLLSEEGRIDVLIDSALTTLQDEKAAIARLRDATSGAEKRA